MESEESGGVPRETVTLTLGEERFEVEKRRLIERSQYFAALLSANYAEHGRTEHAINYDISPILLQDFIHWIHNDEIPGVSATRRDYEELERLLILLELGVLFAADSLIDGIADRLERHFILPKYAIHIWLVTQELNVSALRDLALAACLDRFEDLPMNSITELSREHFLKLFGNVNVRTAMSYRHHVAHEWMKRHDDFTIPVDTLKNKPTKILHSIVTESNNREQFVHCWDGDDFFELASFEYPPDVIEYSCSFGKSLEGMQIIGRRYDLYLCGGEYGIGTGKFNRQVWRYSLISKKWFLETNTPSERRHMIAVFIEDKLLLVGGVGRYRQKLRSVDIYDVCTGSWTSGADMTSLQFTSVPEHFVFNDELIIYQFMPTIYIYFFNKDVWETQSVNLWERVGDASCECEFFPHDDAPINMPILTVKTMPCYIDVSDRDNMVFRAITETCGVKNCDRIIKPLIHKGTSYANDHLCHVLLRTKYANPYGLFPLFGQYSDTIVYLLLWTIYTDRFRMCDLKTLHLHSIPIRNPRKFGSLTLTSCRAFSLPKRFFRLLHPANLHTTSLDHI